MIIKMKKNLTNNLTTRSYFHVQNIIQTYVSQCPFIIKDNLFLFQEKKMYFRLVFGIINNEIFLTSRFFQTILALILLVMFEQK